MITKKTLHISDLDGSLLNQNAELSAYTITTLNRLIENGMYFSVATARTAATCNRILDKLNLNVPIVLMNGVLVYDIQRKNYIKKELLTKKKVFEILLAMKRVGQAGLMYALNGDSLETYYECIPNKAINDFIDERIKKFNKIFKHTDSFSCVNADIIYFCFIDCFDRIHRLYDELILINGLHIEKYQDIYSDDEQWYMEVFSEKASKNNAVNFLCHKYGFNYVISFGDNLNDLPLFRASDECYAVANAKDEVKKMANAVIGSNTDNGVAKWIENHI